MYTEKRKIRINWVGLILKLILLILILFAIYLIYRGLVSRGVLVKKMPLDEFTTNINAMKDSAFEYFTLDRLPEKEGNTKKLTLKEMIDQKLLIDFTNNGKACDLENSYVQVTKTSDSNYALKVLLNCNKQSDYIVTTIENKANICGDKDCQKENEEVKEEISTEVAKQNNSSIENSQKSTNNTTYTTKTTINKNVYHFELYSHCSNCCVTPECQERTPEKEPDIEPTPTTEAKKIRYYKHVKYSSWTTKVLTGENVETKTEIQKITATCPINYTKTIYTTAVMSHHTLYYSQHSYEMNVSKLLNNEGYDYKVKSASYFSSDADYSAYLAQSYKPTYIIGDTIKGNVCLNDLNNIKNASLNNLNFTFSLGSLYNKNNTSYLPVTINYKNAKNVNPICNCYTKEQVFFLPIKITFTYTKDSDCSKNKTVVYYRSYTYKWTTNIHEEGYIYTGISEERNA